MDTSNVKIKVLPQSNESVSDIMEKSSKERLDNLKQKYANFKKEQKGAS
jgi:translation elongation factor EF-1beta